MRCEKRRDASRIANGRRGGDATNPHARSALIQSARKLRQNGAPGRIHLGLAKQYGLSRDSVYRHCHALGLFEKRRRNLRAALERIVEQSESVQVNASAVVAAAQALAKTNAAGQWIDRTEQVNLNELIERMSTEELETYAREGALPEWFTNIVDATPREGEESKANE